MGKSESFILDGGALGKMSDQGELAGGISCRWSLLGPLTWLLIPGGAVQAGKAISAGDGTAVH